MSDLDDEINNATISFVPQVGAPKKKSTSHPHTDPGVPQQPLPQGYGGQPPQAAYGLPPQGLMMGSPMMVQQQQNTGLAGFQSFPPPPNPYANNADGNNNMYPAAQWAAGPPSKGAMMNNNGGMMMYDMGQPMMGQPVSPYMSYPAAAAYAPGQPGAMILLVQEAPDLDFQAPFFGCESCVGCMNHYFLTYCQLARQQNMIRELTADPTSIQHTQNGCKTFVNENRATEISGRLTSYNGCCAAALAFDIGAIALGVFLPQFGGPSCGTGLCIQNMQVRQQIRARFGILPHQAQDCFASWCCSPCATAQQEKELMMRGANPNLVCGDERPNAATMRRMN